MSKTCYFVIKFYHKTSINGKTCITKSYAYSNRNGHSPKYTGWERMSMPTSFKNKQLVCLMYHNKQFL